MPRFEPNDPDAFVDELARQISAHILAEMPTDPSGELVGKGLGELLMIYGNWRSRFVRPTARTVEMSSQLKTSAKLSEHKTAVDEIVRAIEAGDDLTPRLSRGVKTAYEPTATRNPKLHRRSDLDLLIADWGLHHLHLGTGVEADGFVARTDDLLFAGFSDDAAYLIGIYPHGSWALQELVEILVTDWPGNPVVSQSFSGFRLIQRQTDAEHLEARKGGVAQFVEINDTVYMPGSGMTTAGTPIHVTMRRNAIMDTLDRLRSHLPEILSELDKQFPPQSSTEVWEPMLDGDTLSLKRGAGRAPIADLW
jgi:hypothetical protein